MNSSSKNLLIGIGALCGIVTLLSLVGGGGGGAFALGIVAFIGLVAYFIPSFVALEREHGNSTAIIALNVLLGWLLVPWIAALIWALSRNRAAELIKEVAHNVEKEQRMAPRTSGTTDERVCPFCAETVKAAAKICKHCRSELPPTPAPAPKVEPAKGVCPSCSAVIPLDSQECSHCRADFGPHSSWSIRPL